MSSLRFLCDEEIEDVFGESSGDNDSNFGYDNTELVLNEDEDLDYLLSDDTDRSDSDENQSQNEEYEENNNEIADPLFISKDGRIWNSEPTSNQSGRIRSENIITLPPGVTRYAKSRIDTPKDAFLLYFPKQIEKIIIENSNAFGQAKYGLQHIEIDSNLLYAYIGVLILAGVYRSNNETTDELFDEDNGRPIFRAIMPQKTFRYLNSIIRFDNTMSRRQQSSSDKFEPIRDLFEKWNNLLPNFYNPYESVTVDEQLLGFRGKCPFRQYMPSKPAKYGLKFWMLVCSKTYYVWRIQPYLGKPIGALTSERNQGQRVVLDLVDGLKGHNVTIDNFFSSHELGQILFAKGLTMVGTMRKNKRSIPPKLLECRKLPLYTSTFAFTENTVLVSYVGRKNKCTILQSTFHDSNDVGCGPKKLPAIIDYL
ncbi:piggyBac transposable element-derived protein 4-like [Condylostylus longicornis]|uniref:piggyBac transposable element-derived protein 4-like n=1 Tax=Condylostylus longicornis TaxID=2530218 RepID=UPI00244DAFDD|nr:piggyBac transposable element-derived protein 4-like [Condylostylus longicornis]